MGPYQRKTEMGGLKGLLSFMKASFIISRLDIIGVLSMCVHPTSWRDVLTQISI